MIDLRKAPDPELVIWKGETWKVHKPIGDKELELESLDGELRVVVARADVAPK